MYVTQKQKKKNYLAIYATQTICCEFFSFANFTAALN